jgi:hypothetical protein
MQFFLPPQYHRYNDGGDMEGRGLYIWAIHLKINTLKNQFKRLLILIIKLWVKQY